MTLDPADYMVARLRTRMPWAAKTLGELETEMLKRALAAIDVERPVYVTGLARAGTTVLTEILAELPAMATHRYADRALPHAPVLWRRLQNYLTRRDGGKTERAHGDGLHVDRLSPEAAEEPLWRDAQTRTQADETAHLNPSFKAFYRHHTAKVIHLDGGQRYLAKNNDHVGRIAALISSFAAPKILIVVREPKAHVASLMRQHARFCTWAESEPRIARHMRDLGHTEFGPQRQPPHALTSDMAAQVQNLWRRGADAAGWAQVWTGIYETACDAAAQWPGSVRLVSYEALCTSPASVLQELGDWLEEAAALATVSPRWTARLCNHTPTADPLEATAAQTVAQTTAKTQERLVSLRDHILGGDRTAWLTPR